MMYSNTYKNWGEKGTLFYCPNNKVVWERDKENRIHLHKDMPTYGVERRRLPDVQT